MSRHQPKGPILSLVSICSLVAFLILGFVYGMWHPGWIVFFATPVTAAILNVMGIKDEPKGEAPKDSSTEK